MGCYISGYYRASRYVSFQGHYMKARAVRGAGKSVQWRVNAYYL